MELLYDKSMLWVDGANRNTSTGSVQVVTITQMLLPGKSRAEFDAGSLAGPYLSFEEVKKVIGSRVRLLPRFFVWE